MSNNTLQQSNGKSRHHDLFRILRFADHNDGKAPQAGILSKLPQFYAHCLQEHGSTSWGESESAVQLLIRRDRFVGRDLAFKHLSTSKGK